MATIRVSSHKAKRGKKTVVVKEHNKKQRFRSVNSSFIDRVSERPEGGYTITIKGRDYPYPLLPNEKVGSLVSGRGTYYNKTIRGRFF